MSTKTTQIIISGKDEFSRVAETTADRFHRQLNRMETDLVGMRREMDGVATAAKVAFGVMAGGYLASQIKDVTLLSARYDTLGVVMGVVGNNAGYTRAEMAAFQVALEKTGISALESRNNLSAMASANMDLTKAVELARLSQNAAVIGNINSSEAFQRLIHGIKSAQVEVLRNIGINVSFENSYKTLAAQLGVTTAELTEQQKMQARLNAVLAQAPALAGAYEASMEQAGKKLNSTTRYAENARIKLGQIFQPALVLLVDTYTDALKSVNEQLSRTDVIDSWARTIKSEVLDIMQMGAALNMVLSKAGQAASVVGMGVYGPGAALGLDNSVKGFEHFAQAFMDYEKQYGDSEKYLNDLISEQEKLLTGRNDVAKAGADIAEQRRISAGNAARAEAAAAALALADTQALTKETEKAVKEQEKLFSKLDDMQEKGRLALTASEDRLLMRNAGMEDAKARAQTYMRDLQEKDLRLVTEFSEKFRETVLGETDFKLAQIDAQADAYRRAQADEVAVTIWAAQEKLAVSREWSAGVTRGLDAYADAATDAASHAEEFVSRSFQGMEDALVGFVTTGKFEFASLADSIISDLIRIAAQQAILGPISQGLSGMDLGGLFGGLFGGGGPSPSVMPSGGAGLYYSVGHHGGGIVGSGEHSFIRPVPASAFAGAPRHHDGFLPDEYPAILKKDEGVFTPGQMKALGGGGSVNIVVHNYAPGTKAEARVKNDGNGGKSIEVMIDESTGKNLSRFGSASERSMRRNYNLRPALTAR